MIRSPPHESPNRRPRLIRGFVDGTTVSCEIGAGDGAVANSVARHVASALALDVTDALAVPDNGKFSFRVFDGFDLAVPDGSLDVVYSNDVVEHLHLDDTLEQARAIQRALRPGRIYICVTRTRSRDPTTSPATSPTRRRASICTNTQRANSRPPFAGRASCAYGSR